MEHRDAWKGWLGKGSRPFPEEQDLLHRSCRGDQRHLEAERLPNTELSKTLRIAHFLLFFSSATSELPTCAHLNCPLLAAESSGAGAAGRRAGKEPGEGDYFHRQLVNAEHLLRVPQAEVAFVPAGNTAMEAGASAPPFQLPG